MRIKINLEELTLFLQKKKKIRKEQKVTSVYISNPKKFIILVVAGKEITSNKIEEELLRNLNDEEMLEMLNRPLFDLDVSVRTMGILRTTGLKTLRDVISRDEKFFRKYRGFGNLSVFELKKTLREKGLKLSD